MTTLRIVTFTGALVIAAAAWPVAQNQGTQAPPGGQAATQPAREPGAQRATRPPRQRTRKVVLAWADTRNGQSQHDSVSHALAVIERLGYDSGIYDTYIRTDSHIAAMDPKKTTGEPASGGPNLRMADAVFFLGHRDVPIDEQQKNDLLKFVREDGKGLVAAHIALTAFDSWPAFGELLGGKYDGHPWGNADGTIVNEAPDFPATKHFPASFAFHDEFYQPKEFSREKARVLLRLDVSKMPANANYRLKGDMPIAWAKNYGKGRVFYSSFGHDASTWDNRDVGQMYLEAMKWALGLTDGDVTPRPLPTSQ